MAVSCDAVSEICCVAGAQGRCIQKATAPKGRPCGTEDEERRCDEAADCAQGERCCEGTDFNASCEPAQVWRCTKGTCEDRSDATNELCLPGSTCFTGACKVESGETRGHCPLPDRHLSCGARTCAVGESCCWDATAKTGRCIADGACESPGLSGIARLFSCQHPADCGSGFECFDASASASQQHYKCDKRKCHPVTQFLGPFLCDTNRDCGPGRKCIHRDDDPSGVRTCISNP